MIRKLKKPLIFLIILVIIVGSIALFIVFNSTPDRLTEEERDQAVADILGRKPNLNPDIKTGNTSFDGEAIYFEYPAKAVIYDYVDPGKANNDSNIETFSFDMENPRLVLNYTAVNKPNLRDVLDDPSAKLREDETRGYEKEDSFTINGVEAAVYKKTGGGSVKAEKTAFVLNNGILYIISITGSSIEDVEDLFESVVKSAYFK